MKSNILVTGSDGYIGKHLVKMLNNIGSYNVFTLDIKDDVNFNIDIRDGLEVMRVGRYLDFDAIIHLAALVRMNESVKSPSKYYETNIMGTINLLKYIHTKNFVFASTGGAENPTNPYGLSKLAAEDIVRQFAPKKSTIFRFYNVTGTDGLVETHQYQLHYRNEILVGGNPSIFRFYNVTGTDGFPPTNPDGLLFNLINATKTGSFDLYGTDYNTKDGTALREYVHVNDICRALISSIDICSDKIENLAYGDPKTVLEIINKFKEVNNVNFDIVQNPRRDGDAESMFLKHPSIYMERNYTYDQLLVI